MVGRYKTRRMQGVKRVLLLTQALIVAFQYGIVQASGNYELNPHDKVDTLLNTSGIVYVIKEDLFLQGNLIIASGHSLQTTDGNTTTLIAGSPADRDYVEGVGDTARFDHIKGIIHLTNDIVLVVDSLNDCLRAVNRNTSETSVYLGDCTNNGYRDGDDPLFWNPAGLIRDVKNTTTLFTICSITDVLRSIDTTTNTTQTLIASSELAFANDLTQNQESGDIYITTWHSVIRYDYNGSFLTTISGSDTSGYTDNVLSLATYSNPQGIVIFGVDMLLVADKDNNVIRVLHLQTNSTTWSICSGVSGYTDSNITSCQLASPSAMLVLDGKIYKGQDSRIRFIENITSISATTTTTQTTTSLDTSTQHETTSESLITDRARPTTAQIITRSEYIGIAAIATSGFVVTVLIIVGGVVLIYVFKSSTPNNVAPANRQ